MNKKFLVLVSAGILVVLLIGALIFGVDWNHKVGICYRSGTDESNARYRDALENSLVDLGVSVVSCNAQGDPAVQLDFLQKLAEEDCDVLLVEPVSATVSKELSDALQALELPAVVTGLQVDRSASDSPITYLGLDPARAGAVQAEIALALPDGGDLNGDGAISYVVLPGPEKNIEAQLRTGALAYTLSTGQLQAHELAVKQGPWTKESGQQLCQEALSEFGIDIEVIFCGSDQIAQGAVAAVTDSGWLPGTDVYLIGIGTGAETLQLIQDGQLSGSVAFDEAAFAQYMSNLLHCKLVGEALPQQPDFAYTPVTP